jgi:hypothetical protein
VTRRRQRRADTTGADQQQTDPAVIPTQAGPSDEDVAQALIRWQRRRATAAVTVPSPPDIAALVARELDARAQAATEAAYDAGKHPSGPCAYCGAESVVATDPTTGRQESGWCPIGELVVCRLCHITFFEEFTWRHVGATPAELDAMRKITLAQRVLGLGTSLPWLAFVSPRLFAGLPIWWHEIGTRPATSEAERFRHIDADELRRHWDRIIRNEPDEIVEPDFGEEYEQLCRRPCPRCGATGSWVRDLSPDPDWRCRHCEHRAAHADPPSLAQLGDRWHNGYLRRNEPDEVVACLLGVDVPEPVFGFDPVAGLARRVGFAWGWEARGDRHRTATGPWAHLDVPAMRRRLERQPVG